MKAVVESIGGKGESNANVPRGHVSMKRDFEMWNYEPNQP